MPTRMITAKTRICKYCKKEKTIEEFKSKSKKSLAGYSLGRACRECRARRTKDLAKKWAERNSEEVKVCMICGETKKRKDYYRRHRTTCKKCINKRNRSNHVKRKDSDSTYTKKFQVKYKFGIDFAQYQSIYAEHDHKCAICGSNKYLGLDHCHSTGKIRGVLCIVCNTRLNAVEDKAYRTLAEEYLASHRNVRQADLLTTVKYAY